MINMFKKKLWFNISQTLQFVKLWFNKKVLSSYNFKDFKHIIIWYYFQSEL